MKPQRARDIFNATEAEFDDEALKAKVTIIRPGMSANRKNWTPEALKKASESGFWNGSRMYLDHASQTGGLPKKRSRSIKDLVSGIESTEVADDGRVVATVSFFDNDFYGFAKRAKNHIGTSVDLLFAGHEVKEPGKQPWYAVEELVTNNSVDWVVFPAAGGKIDEFLAAHEGEDGVEWSELTREMIAQHRPDLIPASESTSGNPPTGSGTPATITADDVAKLVKQGIQEAREEWVKDQSTKDSVRHQYANAINGTGLPSKVKTRLITAFEGESAFDQAKVDGAITQAQEELAEAGVKPHVRNAGNSSSSETTQSLSSVAPTHAAIESVFVRKPMPGTKSTEGGNA